MIWGNQIEFDGGTELILVKWKRVERNRNAISATNPKGSVCTGKGNLNQRMPMHSSKEELIAAEPDIAAKTIYCGPIDAFYDFKLGTLEYRSLRFETETLDEQDHQGVAVVNYTEREIPYTRIIEHKHFEFGTQEKTVITREYPADWKPGDEPYYPINDAKNEALYKQYEELAAQEGDVIFAGRLGGYKYYDMDKAIAAAFELVRNELGVEPTEA